MKKIIIIIILVTAVIASFSMQLGKKYSNRVTGHSAGLLPHISDYSIFTGNPVNLTPAADFHLYELATGLFTDYAEKQRLIKLPPGYTITVSNNGLPELPDGTILVKTFYYYNDKRDTSKGKRLIETRLLIKSNSRWLTGTYVWNKEQTEAVLATGGSNTAVSFTDANANRRSISYRIPSNKDCATCHSANNSVTPIGFTIQSMNIDVVRNNAAISQLSWFGNLGIMNRVDPSQFATLPNWQHTAYTIEERARAYLAVNCAHCHNEKGSCARSALRFAYDVPLERTRIAAKKSRIEKMMSKGRMPRIGTTIIDEEALALIKTYLKSLP